MGSQETEKRIHMSKSILQPEEPKQCYVCGRQYGLEKHHVFAGVANRRLSERWGLWIFLCDSCHRSKEGAQYEQKLNLRLKQEAQEAFEKLHGHDLFMDIFKKNYL